MLKLTPLLFVLVIFQGCAPATKVSCGDLFSEYAEKPAKLEYLECKKGTGQTVLEATYSVSDKYATDVENVLATQYGLVKYNDYYHSMPPNEVSLEPESLLKIDPYYVLFIGIYEIDGFKAELEMHMGEHRTKKREAFLVEVKVMLI